MAEGLNPEEKTDQELETERCLRRAEELEKMARVYRNMAHPERFHMSRYDRERDRTDRRALAASVIRNMVADWI